MCTIKRGICSRALFAFEVEKKVFTHHINRCIDVLQNINIKASQTDINQ